MTWAFSSALLASSTLAQLCAGWMAVLPIAALAIYGWRRGGFLATIAGLQLLGSFLAAVVLAQPVSGFLESLGCPARQSLAVAYVLVLAAGVVGIRLAVGATVPEGAVRLRPLADHIGGAALGAGAGLVLGGALLVGWSMADLPPSIRLDNTHQPLDSGNRLLRTFAWFAGRGAEGRGLLLDGDRPARLDEAAGVVRASEPFIDADLDGRWAAGPPAEPYLDVDGDGRFTPELSWRDATGDGRRSPGLRDCYRLADWRRVRSMHPPRIDSAATAELQENTSVEEVVYQARATDPDGDAVTFAVEPVPAADEEAADAGPGVAIDPASGAVTLLEPADFERAARHEFVVVATDATGLVSRQRVVLRVRDVSIEPEPAG